MTFAEREGVEMDMRWYGQKGEDKNASRKETERYGDKIFLLRVTYPQDQHKVLLCKKPE